VAALGLVVTGLLAAGCGDGGADDEAGSDTAAPTASDGAALYQEACASCHGTDLRGTDQGPSHLSVVYEPGHHSDDAFRAAIAQGSPAHHWEFGDMPPVPGLAPDEVEAIIAFVRDQQEAQGFEPYPPG
jgi:mono/diheme cytochrome c family protein